MLQWRDFVQVFSFFSIAEIEFFSTPDAHSTVSSSRDPIQPRLKRKQSLYLL